MRCLWCPFFRDGNEVINISDGMMSVISVMTVMSVKYQYVTSKMSAVQNDILCRESRKNNNILDIYTQVFCAIHNYAIITTFICLLNPLNVPRPTKLLSGDRDYPLLMIFFLNLYCWLL